MRGRGQPPQWRAYANGSNCPKHPRNVTFSGECSRAPDWPIKATGVTRAPNTGPPDPPTEAAAYSEGSEQNFLKKIEVGPAPVSWSVERLGIRRCDLTACCPPVSRHSSVRPPVEPFFRPGLHDAVAIARGGGLGRPRPPRSRPARDSRSRNGAAWTGAPQAGLIIESLGHTSDATLQRRRVRTLVDRTRCPSGWRAFFGEKRASLVGSLPCQQHPPHATSRLTGK